MWLVIMVVLFIGSLSIKFFRFTGLLFPFVWIYIWAEIEKTNRFDNKLLDNIGLVVLAITIIISVLMFIKNVIKIFKSDFSYLGILRRKKNEKYINVVRKDNNGNIVLNDGRVLKDITDEIK